MKSVIHRLLSEEHHRQDVKWGVRNHNDYKWLAILSEEVGELAEQILNNNEKEVLKELVQVTSVGVQWLESIMRRK